MGFEKSDRVQELDARLGAFMDKHVYPREHDWEEFTLDPANLWQTPDWFDGLREQAKAEGLWNLFLPKEYAPWSPGLSNVEIATLFETMSKVSWAQPVFNCRIAATWKSLRSTALPSSRSSGLSRSLPARFARPMP